MNKVLEAFEERNKSFLESKILVNKQYTETLRKKNRRQIIEQKRIFQHQHFDEDSVQALIHAYPAIGDESLSVSEKFEKIMRLFNDEEFEKIDLLLECLANFNKSTFLPDFYLSVDISSKLLSCLQTKNTQQIKNVLLIIINSTYTFTEVQKSLIKHGGTEILLSLILSNFTNPDLMIDALWALSHIISDEPQECSKVMSSGLYEKLLSKLSNDFTISQYYLEICLSFISSLLKNFKSLDQSQLSLILQLIPKFLTRNESEILSRCFWILDFIAENSKNIRRLMIPDIINRLYYGIRQSDKKIKNPALRLAGLLILGNNNETAAIVELGIVDVCFEALAQEKRDIEDLMWILGNVALDCEKFKEMILNHPCFGDIVKVVKSEFFGNKIQALELLEVLLDFGFPEQVANKVKVLVPCLIEVLKIMDSRVLKPALNCLILLITSVQTLRTIQSPYPSYQLIQLLQELGGLDQLESLINHPNSVISELCVSILTNHLTVESISDPYLNHETLKSKPKSNC